MKAVSYKQILCFVCFVSWLNVVGGGPLHFTSAACISPVVGSLIYS